VAALRGHEVTVVEKGERLGGHLIEASVPKFKEKTKQLLDWAINQARESGVKVRLGTEATASLIKQAKPEVLMVAIGSDFLVPPVPGCDKECAATAGDVLLGKKTPGDKVVVIGAGLIGCETALYLADELKKQVTIIEMLDEMLVGVQGMCQAALEAKLEETGVVVHLGWRLDEVGEGTIVCRDGQGQRFEMEADTVVLATGLVARAEAVDRFKGLAPEVYIVGDCREARKIYHCFEDAWRAVLQT